MQHEREYKHPGYKQIVRLERDYLNDDGETIEALCIRHESQDSPIYAEAYDDMMDCFFGETGYYEMLSCDDPDAPYLIDDVEELWVTYDEYHPGVKIYYGIIPASLTDDEFAAYVESMR